MLQESAREGSRRARWAPEQNSSKVMPPGKIRPKTLRDGRWAAALPHDLVKDFGQDIYMQASG
eukprot:7084047-Pyramimonas_sp.AAC.1